MGNPNLIRRWPLYRSAGSRYVRALPIRAIHNNTDGTSTVSFNDGYSSVTIYPKFIEVFSPVVGSYLFYSESGEFLSMADSEFNSTYEKVFQAQKPTKSIISATLTVTEVTDGKTED